MSPSIPAHTIGQGALAGLIGGVTIWGYEAAVWVHVQHLMPLAGIPGNAVGLTFGRTVQVRLGPLASPLGAAIHFGFAMAWGMAFALAWPWLRRRGCGATLAALLLAPVLWVVMHGAIVLFGGDHPNYADPLLIIGGVLSHLFYTVPTTIAVKRMAKLSQ